MTVLPTEALRNTLKRVESHRRSTSFVRTDRGERAFIVERLIPQMVALLIDDLELTADLD